MTVFEFLLKLAATGIPPIKLPKAPSPKGPIMTSPEGIKTDDFKPEYTPTNFNVSNSKKYQIK